MFLKYMCKRRILYGCTVIQELGIRIGLDFFFCFLVYLLDHLYTF